jgi:predicted MFS family arabinose efflux permease
MTVVLLFGAIFAAELGWAGISPLLPSFQQRYSLTDVATALIVTVASFGVLLVSVPASGLTNRFSVRTLTLWSLGAITLGNLGSGFAGSYAEFLVARSVFGMGLGILWVTGTAWLHDAAGKSGPRALALTSSVVGAAGLIAPALTGYFGERYSLGAPFFLLGSIAAMILVALGLLRSPDARNVDPGPPLPDMLRAARDDTRVRTSLVADLAVGLMWMSADVLVPLRLAARGFTPSEIGLTFSASSIVFVVVSAVVSARAERFATIRLTALWTGVFAACVLVPVASVAVAATIAFVVAMSMTTGILVAVTYPLAIAGATRGGFNVALVGALMGLDWAVSGLLGPTLGGSVAQIIGDRVWFLALAIGSLGAAGWMWRRRESVIPSIAGRQHQRTRELISTSSTLDEGGASQSGAAVASRPVDGAHFPSDEACSSGWPARKTWLARLSGRGRRWNT